ncbi:hypothetical protein B484DRAFT_415026 [Ochromonadaceae sp. CCMP2298]|nr:hypothetical protein B484DRAFT_415026 [Ochromonadaceae sp. CCMP2298]
MHDQPEQEGASGVEDESGVLSAASDDSDFAGLTRRVFKLVDYHRFQPDGHADRILDSVPALWTEWRRDGYTQSTLRARFSRLRKWWKFNWPAEDLTILCKGTLDLLAMWAKQEVPKRA